MNSIFTKQGRHIATAVLATTVSHIALGAPLPVSVIFPGNSGQIWTKVQQDGIDKAERNLKGEVTITRVENVADGIDSERVMRERATKGDKVVIGTSFGYMDGMLKTARSYPDTIFLHCSGYKTSANMGTYNGRMYEAVYLAGVAAATKTKSHVLGFIGAVPVPEVVRDIDAFAIGARSVDPKNVVKVVWINAWFDPGKERVATETLIGLGADVLLQNTASNSPMTVAEEHKVFAFGWDGDMRQYGPHAQLGAITYDWSGYYTQQIKTVIAGQWKSEAAYWGIKEGMLDLTNINTDLLPATTIKLIDERRQAIVDGKLDPFAGPLKDQSGQLRVPAGQKISRPDSDRLDWLVEGVDGKLK